MRERDKKQTIRVARQCQRVVILWEKQNRVVDKSVGGSRDLGLVKEGGMTTRGSDTQALSGGVGPGHIGGEVPHSGSLSRGLW